MTHLIRRAKRTFYDGEFERAKDDLKVTWKLINEIINKRKSKSTMPSTFKIDGISVTDPVTIVETFCQYFSSVGPSLAKKISPVNHSFTSFLSDNSNSPITILPTNQFELYNICRAFKLKKSSGYDNIPMHIIKKSFDIICQPLVNLINLSLTTGIFPDKLKIAKVIPIYKMGDNDCFANYRPISLLANFSKFFEKVMYNRLLEFIEKHDILYSSQFGFREKHSTSLAITHLVNNITSAIDRKEITVGVFLDHAKVFDTIDHDIFLAKLDHYGIRGQAQQWISSYFYCRKQYVQYKETFSSYQTIKCGVPQGSILGPLLFLLYINDISNASIFAESLIFTDDTSVFYSHSNPNYLQYVMNNELQNFDLWLKSNKLSVNVKKTKYVIFKTSKKKINHSFLLHYDNETLHQVNSIKFLGVYIDQNLTWKDHINHVSKKISKSIGIIHISLVFIYSIFQNYKVSLYYTLVYPFIAYCNMVWSSTYVTNLNRIYYLQKRVVRAITNSDFRARTAPLFMKLGILDIFQVNSLYIARFMFCYHNEILPPVFHDLFQCNNQIHSYNTRSANNYRPQAYRSY